MEQHNTILSSSGRWSPRKALFIVVVGAAVGWVAAIVSVYGVMRSMDGDSFINAAPTSFASDQDFEALSNIAPAAGGENRTATPEASTQDSETAMQRRTDTDQP